MRTDALCDPHPLTLAFPGLIGRAPALMHVLDRAARAARSPLPVLVLGESGTGKELVARGLHALGPRPDAPLINMNCGALPRELIESELFGHERGAFTGAGGARGGWFEAASDGTLVLDEIGELPLELQPKLLRVLETGRYFRIGGRSERTTQARIVALTNRDLRIAAACGAFRLDLYHRLAGVELRLPPLRERLQDLPLLIEHFRREWCREGGLPEEDHPYTDQQLPPRLVRHDFPGNVRELRNLVRRTLTLHGLPLSGETLCQELFFDSTPTLAAGAGSAAAPTPGPFWSQAVRAAEPGPVAATSARAEDNGFLALDGKSWAEIERAAYMHALRRAGGSRRAAARLLGVSRSTFNDRVRRMGLTGPAGPEPMNAP